MRDEDLMIDTRDAEVVVVGLGIAGALTTWLLARAGHDVLAVERFEPGHGRGASHGESRLFRTLSWEGPLYPALAARSAEIYRALEAETAARLWTPAPDVAIGPRNGTLVREVLANARTAKSEVEVMEGVAARAEYPHWRLRPDDVVVREEHGAVLRPEVSVRSAVDAARTAGARIVTGTSVEEIRDDGAGGLVVACDRVRVRAERVVIAVGAWITGVEGLASAHIEARRSPLAWFKMKRPGLGVPPRFPAFVWERDNGRYWGIPDVDGTGTKVGGPSGLLRSVDANADDPVRREELAGVRSFVAEAQPDLDPEPTRTAPCMDGYARTGHFVLGPVAADDRLVLCVGLSGHGFKHAGAVAEIVSGWVTGKDQGEVGRFFLPPADLGAGLGPGRTHIRIKPPAAGGSMNEEEPDGK